MISMDIICAIESLKGELPYILNMNSDHYFLSLNTPCRLINTRLVCSMNVFDIIGKTLRYCFFKTF